MAITKVRVKLEGVWTTLTYNSSTARWEGNITPAGTSIHQPGGYFSLTAEATNSNGQTDTLTGSQIQSLRLVVRETTAPVVTLVSPAQGWLTTNTPRFVFEASDEAGGSGLDTSSARATIDGVSVSCSLTASGSAYRLTFGGQVLSEGPHTVTASVADRDGNRTTVTANYQVDTVPPKIVLTLPESHRVVDWAEVTIAGAVSDATAGVASVHVGSVSVTPDGEGKFSLTVPLEVGENNITVTAVDHAGLQTTALVWMLRLITDRVQADVDRVAELSARAAGGIPFSQWPAADRTYWLGILKGAYKNLDMNRVGIAVDYLTREFTARGYAPITQPKKDWTAQNYPTLAQRQTYLDNVAQIAGLLPVQAPALPPDMEGFDFMEANAVEANLVAADSFFPWMDRSPYYSDEIYCGEE
ncbi:hypothetical protein D1641_01305 [Colidextribacter sp. OB.20]|uniref:hypothetical protein n=1 Tax=Colidextribacter sp. OB.20 TaxID=2304568 RepID=UPI00136C268B|nr:hypothetical protein [Colidextribacter sp. OB.20]NBI08657.1 hypothetical protein [Colidextribacter sp. OB.20]